MKYLSVAVLVVVMIGVPCMAAQQLADTHLEVAEEWLNEMGFETMLEELIDSTLSMQLEQTPQLVQFEDVMRAYLHKYMSWEYLREPVVQIYAEAFTEQELREIMAFYDTETGRKVMELTPELMSRGMALGQKAVEEHLPELETMILERMQELDSGN